MHRPSSLPSPARRFGWRSRCTAGLRERRRPSPTVCLSGPMRFRDARLPEWDTARSGSLTRRKLPLLPSLDRPSPWTGWFRWNHRNKGGTSRPCFSRTTEKQKATAFAVAFYFGGERGIRTLERVLAVTRFPIVRLRPAQPSFHDFNILSYPRRIVKNFFQMFSYSFTHLY